MDNGNWKRIDDVLLPEPLVFAIHRMCREKKAGQVILNFNDGKIQSFEVKEHTRL